MENAKPQTSGAQEEEQNIKVNGGERLRRKLDKNPYQKRTGDGESDQRAVLDGKVEG